MSSSPITLKSAEALELTLRAALDIRVRDQQLRSRRVVEPIDSTHVRIDGRSFVNFASNDYLGLTNHLRLQTAAKDAIDRWGVGAGAAGLISGYSIAHANAEHAIAAWKRTEAAVLLPSGYQANLAAVQAIIGAAKHAGRPVRFLLDKLCHASLIDAVGGSGAAWRVFPHNGLDKLERLLATAPLDERQIVVTESIFSMDGDAADLHRLVMLREQYPCVILLDEAHGSGVYGPHGAGLAAELGLRDQIDIMVVTTSKAIGVSGGAICGSQAFCDAVVNFGRAYVYSTAVPPFIAAAISESIAVMRDEPERQSRVRGHARRVRSALAAQGSFLPPGDSPIVPIILGGENQAIALAEKLVAAGLLVVAVRPPTVKPGSSRVRVTLSCDHTDAEIDELIGALTAARE